MKHDFKTEAELCAAFIAWVKAESGRHRHGVKTPVWTPYAETAGWDILLVGEDGTQIGIEAKLKFNMKVLTQCLPDCYDYYGERRGPDFRAVLVPDFNSEHERICAALGLMLIATKGHGSEFRPDLTPERQGWYSSAPGWHFWNPVERCRVPEYVPDVVAGSSAPIQLTDWKIKALRILATVDVRGYVTKDDFKEHRIDPRVWTGPAAYLVPGSAQGQWVRGKAEFDKQHPEVYPKILEEVRQSLKAKEVAPCTPSLV